MQALLFHDFNIFDVLLEQQEKLKSEISALSQSQIENQPEDELIRSIAAKYKLVTPVLEEEKAEVSHQEMDVDVSRDPTRMIWDRSQPFYIRGTELVFVVPFKGDAELFRVRPSTFDYNPPRGDVDTAQIRFAQTRTDNNAAAARVEYDRTLQAAKKYLGWLEASIADFNSKIGAQTQDLVNQRKQQLGHQARMVTELGIPIQKRSGSQSSSPTRSVLKSPEKSLTSPRKWDVFISHASEDKAGFVRDLAKSLRDSGVEVWYDEFSLKLGDSLRASIDYGLANSRYGVVVASKHFFAKQWPVQELNGLWSRERMGKSVILPIWHNIGVDEITEFSPMLADRIAASSASGADAVAKQIIDVLDEQ